MALELGGELLTLWLRFGETQVKDATATSYHLAGKEAKDLAGVTQLSRLRAMCLIFLAPVRAELWVPALLPSPPSYGRLWVYGRFSHLPIPGSKAFAGTAAVLGALP